MRLRLTIVDIGVLVMVAALSGLFALDWHAGYRGERDGRRNARTALHDGKQILKFGGKRQPWTETTNVLCLDRYNIDVEHVRGCTATTYQRNYESSYNGVMLGYITSVAPDFDYNSLQMEAHDHWIASRSP